MNQNQRFPVKNVAIYVRVSSEEQAKEGYSIPAQKRKLKSFCISQDWPIADIYADEGKSAKDIDRPELKRLLKDIEAGKIDCVLVYRLDRLTRSVKDLYTLLEMFDQHDCKFKSATEVYDTTTAMGRLFITLVAALAQWERENMGERLSFGYAEKVRKGKYALNFRPFGYNLDLETSKLSINQNEATTVRLIYDLYLKGNGANKICQYLNERKITTRDGNLWLDKAVMQILKSPLYIGAIKWTDFIKENTHEPIVSKEHFDAVQALIAERRGQHPRRAGSAYIFSGKLRCPTCGRAMVGYRAYHRLANGEKVSYKNYRCRGKSRGVCAGSKSLSEKNLEEGFVRFLKEENFNSLLEEATAMGEHQINQNYDNQVDTVSLQKELEKIERRKKKWQYAWTDDSILYDDFKQRMEEARTDEERIKNQLQSVESVKEDIINREEIESALKEVGRNWAYLEDNEKKSLLDSTIERITVESTESGIRIQQISFKGED